jgi:hypothetical protein
MVGQRRDHLDVTVECRVHYGLPMPRRVRRRPQQLPDGRKIARGRGAGERLAHLVGRNVGNRYSSVSMRRQPSPFATGSTVMPSK